MSCPHSRGAGRRHSVLRLGLSAAALGAGLLATGPAAADTGHASIDPLGNLSIVVTSDGASYTGVESSSNNIEGQVRVQLDAEVSGRVKSFEVWPILSSPYGELSFKGTSISWSKSYSRPRPKTVDEKRPFSIPRPHYQDFVVAACNAQADFLRGAGMGNGAIFAQDRSVGFSVAAGLTYEMSGTDGVSDGPPQIQLDNSFKVICKAAPPPPRVEQATLAARGESNLSGACSVKLSGTIRTNYPNTTVKFRYRSDDGRESDLKTLVTSGNGAAAFSDDYPLSQGGTRSGKVRVVGENLVFSSDWADYDVECGAPAGDVMTVLPPEVVRLHAYETEETLHRGLLCPAKVEIHGVLKGRGTASGGAELFAAGESKAQELYAIEDGETIIVKGEHALTWGPTQAQQNVKFTMLVINKQGDLVDQMETTQNFACREPEMLGDAQGAAGDFGSTAPEAPDLSLSVATAGQKVVGSFACPASLSAEAKVKANDAMDLRVVHFLEQPNIMIGQGSQAKEQDFSFVKNQHETFPQSFDLNWQGLHSAAGQPLRQPVKMTVRLYKDRFLVAEQQEELVLTCEGSVAGGQAAPGQKTAGADAPQKRPGSSAIGRLAQQQAQAFAIQAPKGLVRKGEIRLSGGAANAKYSLKFLRKNGGGYVAVNAAQLPKQMTGLVANFPLKALTGGRDWRLEVCPLGGTPTGCQTADFRLTRIGAGAKAPTPSPEQPQGSVFIFPGAAN